MHFSRVHFKQYRYIEVKELRSQESPCYANYELLIWSLISTAYITVFLITRVILLSTNTVINVYVELQCFTLSITLLKRSRLSWIVLSIEDYTGSSNTHVTFCYSNST